MISGLETIVAPASGLGRAGVAVLRISGPQSRFVLETMAGSLPRPRYASLRTLRDPDTGDPLDQALVLWFPSPQSFTGEDVVEFHVHGSVAIRSAILRIISSFEGCRLAEPGEFTRRAFLNGRMDLTEIEGLADLIDAETEAQRRQALRQLQGELRQTCESWRADLIAAMAYLEANLDFSDEGDVPDSVLKDSRDAATKVSQGISQALLQAHAGERLREGVTLVILGPPNAGKSTLLNALARRDVAIVSPVPGTTRDSLEIKLDLNGLPLQVIDTAGLRDSADPIEQEGVSRARRKAAEADVVLYLHPMTDREALPPSLPSKSILVLTKADLVRDDVVSLPPGVLKISAKTGEHLDALAERLFDEAQRLTGHGSALVTRERQRLALEKAHQALQRALTGDFTHYPELMAEELRLAARDLGRIVGTVDVEEVLDHLFSNFCIGK